MTIVETPGFLREAAALTGEERPEVILYFVQNPEAGDVMPGTGGASKFRWRASGRGKRGGARVIYYYHNESAKNEKANLTKAEQNEMKALLPRLVAGYQKRMAQ